MKKMYRACVVGLGNIAWRFDRNVGSQDNFLTHAYSYVNNGKTTLVGGCSPDSKDRYAFEGTFRVPTFSSVDELIDRVNPDIVSICSPTKFHFEHVMYCLERNVSMIWLEKPPTPSTQELDQLVEKLSERESQSKVLLNYQRRYMERYRKLRDIYLKETLGRCHVIQINYSKGLELNGSHLIDMLFFIVGENARCELRWVSSLGNRENPSFALALESSLGVVVSGVPLPYHCGDISLVCENGRASILHGGMTPVTEDRVEHELFPGFYRLKKSESSYLDSDDMSNGMEDALEDLIHSYEEDKEPESSPMSARNTQALIEQVRQKQRNTDQ